MSYRPPRLTHALPAGGLAALVAVRWMIEQQAQLSTFWASIPFGWIAALIGSFWVGLIVQDIYSPHSWIRHNWRQWRRLFDVSYAYSRHQEGEDEYVEIICGLKFLKKLRNPLLTVKVYYPIGVSDPRVDVVIKRRLGDIVADDEQRLRLGSIRIPKGDWGAQHSVWGEALGQKQLLPGQRSITHDAHMVVIAVNHQTYRILAHRLKDREDHRSVYLLTEDEVRLLQLHPNIAERTPL